jgi:hypothetical protein
MRIATIPFFFDDWPTVPTIFIRDGMNMQPVDRPQYQIDEQASGLSPFGGIK